jgi:hypothetical protein
MIGETMRAIWTWMSGAFVWMYLAIAVSTALLPQQDSGAIVEGSVCDTVTDGPVSDARVFLSPVQPSQGRRSGAANTDQHGNFRIENISPGDYVVTVKKLGYVDSSYSDRKAEPIRVEAGALSQRVRIELVPTGTIDGVVLDEEKRPAPGIHVSARRLRRGSPIPDESNEKGWFKLENLAPGDHILEVRVPYSVRRESVRRDPDTGEVTGYPNGQFYPGVDDQGAAAVISVAPGARIGGLQIQLRRTRLVDVTGEVEDAVTRRPLQTAQVELIPQVGGLTDETYERRSIRNPSGAFQFSLLRPGRYSLLVFRDGLPLPWATQIEVGSAGLVERRIRVPGFEQIKGIVTGMEPRSLEVELRQLTSGEPAAKAKVLENGTFVFDQIPPGRWVVRVSGDDVAYPVRKGAYHLSEVRFGQSGAGAFITVSEGFNERLELLMSKASGRLIGTVRDAKDNPVNSAWVFLRPKGPNPGSQIAAKQDGTFVIDALPAGEYSIGAYLGEISLQRPIVCDRFAVKVTIADGITATVQIKLCTE